MAVVIRLSRHGKKGEPQYRVVAADEDYKRDGRYLEVIGTYNPKNEARTIQVKAERLKHWVSKGARLTDTVGRLVKLAGL